MTQPRDDFGRCTWNLDVMIVGARTQEQLQDDLNRLVNFLGMDTAGMNPAIWPYPIPDGRGGEGLTIIQPYVEPLKILGQPLTTSFVVIDSWPEHFSITIKSCMRFSPEAVMQELQRLYGPDSILDCHSWTLGRVARPCRAFCGGGGQG
jgi:hypothetical protein